MALPDNRLRLPAPLIDFTNDVGTTGQDHDDFPEPGQARFDWMRMYLVALLAHQSSYDEPTQYREGTVWFDLNNNTLKMPVITSEGTTWEPISKFIAVEDGADEAATTTLYEWFQEAEVLLASIKPSATWSGSAANATTQIPIPASAQATAALDDMRAFVWVNGLLLDPRNTTIQGGGCPTCIELSGGDSLVAGDTFTVKIEYISDANFVQADVVAG